MKSNIMYYYNFNEIEIDKRDDAYYFRDKGRLYSFEKLIFPARSEKLLLYLYQIGYQRGFKIIFNIYDKMFTNINNEWYVLVLYTEEKVNLSFDILNPIFLPSNIFSYQNDSWDYLWMKKIDYYEYQISHFTNNYPLVQESFNYYVGMAENAISYVRYNLSSEQLQSMNLCLCHNRISSKKYVNPLNLIVDYYPRDIAEYLKFLFFSDNYRNYSFYNLFQSLHFSREDYILLYARLLFPSYYFDVYDDILNKKCSESRLKKIILLKDDYQCFLCNIYKLISVYFSIPEVNWLKKEML